QDQRPAIHLKDCSASPVEVRQAAHRHLMSKGSITAFAGPILPDLIAPAVGTSIPDATSMAADPGPGPSGQASASKKHRFGTLDGYVDQAMSETQKADTDLKFFRFIVHSNSAFLLAHNLYLHTWIQSLRPTYEIPSRYVL
ncbi:hypothetical protein DFH09DRAFT_854652, partial [Mycena vulgaris]